MYWALIILFLLVTPVWAREYYVFIDKTTGEIVRVAPVDESAKPNENELRTHKVLISDLTDEERNQITTRHEDTYKSKTVFDKEKIESLEDEKPVTKTELFKNISVLDGAVNTSK